jgi:hypothetical protein
VEGDSNHRFQKSNSPDFSVGFDQARRRLVNEAG